MVRNSDHAAQTQGPNCRGAIKKTHTVCYFTIASLMKNKAEQELSSFNTIKQQFPFYQ